MKNKTAYILIGITILMGITGCARQSPAGRSQETSAQPQAEAAAPENTPDNGDSMMEKEWTLILDEGFGGEDGASPDPAIWTMETGNNRGWGNSELEYYTGSADNCFMRDGCLVIKAIKEEKEGYRYTSARLKTQEKFSFTYGKAEMRAKLPYGQGIWPAFWMLGGNITTAGWPDCGEIDIMEFIGREPATVFGTLHGPGYSGSMGLQNSIECGDLTDFHTYGIEWDADSIKWYFDGTLYHEVYREKLTKLYTWVFDKDFYLLLNLAVGGQWPGNPDESTVFPQEYVIDYVRVYQQE